MTERPAKAVGVSFTKYARNILSRPGTSGSGTTEKNTKPDLTGHEDREIRANASLSTEGPLSALAASADKRHVVVAGREVLKILEVGTGDVVEHYNLRNASKVNLSYAAADVKWGHGPTVNVIATASSNGSIVLWSVEESRSRKIDRIISDHTRAVNSLDFNPGNGSWLLSASQDGSMKLWDLREHNGRARFVLQAKAEAIRDVQFNQCNALEIAAVCDNGNLQKWDLRNTRVYERKFNAHHGPALAVNWHRDGRHIVTGGRDKTIKVWDLASESRRPMMTVQTMAPVACVAWRPGDVRVNCQVASSAFTMDTNVNLWNLRRPHLPMRVFDAHEDVATGLLWHDQHTIWSCSRDGSFRQHAVNLAIAPIDTLSHYAFGWNHAGDIAVSLGSKVSDKARLAEMEERDMSGGRSVGGLNPSRRNSARNSEERLVDTLKLKIEQYIPVQSFAIIESEDISNELFRYFARHYCISNLDPLDSCTKNAEISHRAQHYQASKTWKMLRLVLEHVDRRHRVHATSQAKRASKASNVSRLTNESLIHRDLERLRGTPALDSGRTTVKAPGSPSTSFIMPRYNPVVPAISLPSSTLPSRPRTADSSARASTVQAIEDNLPPSDPKVELPTTQDFERNIASSSAASGEKSMSFGTSLDSNLNPWGGEDNTSPQAFGSDNSSEVDIQDPAETIDLEKSIATIQIAPSTRQPSIAFCCDRPWSVTNMCHRILDHYQDRGDVQMTSTIALVMSAYIDRPEKQIDEWLLCYIELLHRQRLFTVSAQIANASTSTLIRSMSDTETTIHTTCARCRKAVPTTRTAGAFWSCPRCHNTCLCVICNLTVKGQGSWCLRCSHVTHPRCRDGLKASAGYEGGCTAVGCSCPC